MNLSNLTKEQLIQVIGLMGTGGTPPVKVNPQEELLKKLGLVQEKPKANPLEEMLKQLQAPKEEPKVDMDAKIAEGVNKALMGLFGGMQLGGQAEVNPLAQLAEQMQKQQKESTYVNVNDFLAGGNIPKAGEKTVEEQLAELQKALADRDKADKERQLQDVIKAECYKKGYTPQQADWITKQLDRNSLRVDPQTNTIVGLADNIDNVYNNVKSIIQPTDTLGMMGQPFNMYQDNSGIKGGQITEDDIMKELGLSADSFY